MKAKLEALTVADLVRQCRRDKRDPRLVLLYTDDHVPIIRTTIERDSGDTRYSIAFLTDEGSIKL